MLVSNENRVYLSGHPVSACDSPCDLHDLRWDTARLLQPVDDLVRIVPYSVRSVRYQTLNQLLRTLEALRDLTSPVDRFLHHSGHASDGRRTLLSTLLRGSRGSHDLLIRFHVTHLPSLFCALRQMC